jgi:hypothetical protein
VSRHGLSANPLRRFRGVTRRGRAALILSNAVVRQAKVLPNPGPHELPIAGRAVCAVAVSRFVPFLRLHFWGFGVPASTPGPDYTLEIDGPLQIITAERERTIDPQAGPDAAYLLLLSKTVAQAFASDEGGLAVDFTDGDKLVVPPHTYEAWQMNCEDDSLFVSVAGGGLAVWDAQPKTPE